MLNIYRKQKFQMQLPKAQDIRYISTVYISSRPNKSVWCILKWKHFNTRIGLMENSLRFITATACQT